MEPFREFRNPISWAEWLSVMALAVTVIVAQSLSIVCNYFMDSTPLLLEARFVHLLLAMGVVVVLWLRQSESSRTLTVGAYLLLVALFFPISSLQYWEIQTYRFPMVIFSGHKVASIALAILVAGPYWVNALLLFLIPLHALILWSVVHPDLQQAYVQAGEPLLTIMYGAVGVCLLAFRYRYQKSMREWIEVDARAALLEQMARVFLSARDLANTPLQSLGIAIEILRRDHPNTREILPSIRQSVLRLSFLNRIFRFFEDRLQWRGEGLMSEEEIVAYLMKIERENEVRSHSSKDAA